MAESSEATRRVFEQMLVNLKGKLKPSTVDALQAIIAEGKLADLDAVEAVICAKEEPDADR